MKTRKQRTFTGTTQTEVSAWEKAHYGIAEEAARESFVLLKNDGLLPFAEGQKIALYGQGACRTIKGGIGSGDVNERKSTSIYEGMKKAGFVIANEEWIESYADDYEAARQRWKADIFKKMAEKKQSLFDTYTTTPFIAPVGKSVEKADTDTAVYVLSRTAGEGADRKNLPGDYLLSEAETEMLTDICSIYSKVLLVLNTGGIVDLSILDMPWGNSIRAVLQISQPGMAGGDAFAGCLMGAAVPSGKLTDSWAYHYEDYPGAENFSHNNGNLAEEKYEEGIYVGYRCFDSFAIPVRYGFGYGLSYTAFQIDFQKLEWVENTAACLERNSGCRGELALTVSVRNTGEKYAGKEVVQVYVSCPQGRLPKEHRRLAAFAKTKSLQPGETQEITLHIPPYGLASYDEEKSAYLLEKGYYGIWLGNSLEDSRLCAGLLLKGEEVLVKTTNICPLKQELEEKRPAAGITEQYAAEELAALRKGLPILQLLPEYFQTVETVFEDKLPEEMAEAAELVDQLSTEQCVRLTVGETVTEQESALGAAGMATPGSAGETSHCGEDNNLASITLADGPAGLRLAKYYHVDRGSVLPLPFELTMEGGFFYEESRVLPGERYYQYCTAIPVGTALAQTWNEELIEKVGTMIGEEMETYQVTLWLAPGMNIHRNPLCGRNFEYYSEDPLLSGKMAAAMTKGVQKVDGCGTTIKHFACNNQEDNRMHCDSVLSERALREIYLRGFEIAVKQAGPLSIMTSYNLINGVHAANCYDTCTKVARDEWGFGGLIMTDWTTTHNDPACTAAGCILAGNDLIMPGEESDRESIRAALASGELSEEQLRKCVTRIAHIILQSGQYEK